MTEALAALVLVAIVLPVAMQGVSLATSAGGRAARQVEAVGLAESKLDELVATGAWREGEMSGDFAYAPSGRVREERGGSGTEFGWSAEVRNWHEDAVRLLEVRVTWRQRGAEREVVLTTLVVTREGVR